MNSCCTCQVNAKASVNAAVPQMMNFDVLLTCMFTCVAYQSLENSDFSSSVHYSSCLFQAICSLYKNLLQWSAKTTSKIDAGINMASGSVQASQTESYSFSHWLAGCSTVECYTLQRQAKANLLSLTSTRNFQNTGSSIVLSVLSEKLAVICCPIFFTTARCSRWRCGMALESVRVLQEIYPSPRWIVVDNKTFPSNEMVTYGHYIAYILKELSQTRNAKVISSSHDSLILKLNNSSTHFSFYQHKPFDSPPASHSPDLTSTTVQLFYSDFWFLSITFQLRNHRSLVGAVTVPCQSQHIWTLRRLPVGLCYLGQNRAAAIALPCSGGLYRQKLTKKTHIKKNATFLWWCFLMCLKFLSICF